MKNQVLAICKKTYPDEDDMQKYCDGKIIEPSDVKIYHKGRKYLVMTEFYNEKYYTLVESNSPIT